MLHFVLKALKSEKNKKMDSRWVKVQRPEVSKPLLNWNQTYLILQRLISYDKKYIKYCNRKRHDMFIGQVISWNPMFQVLKHNIFISKNIYLQISLDENLSIKIFLNTNYLRYISMRNLSPNTSPCIFTSKYLQ